MPKLPALLSSVLVLGLPTLASAQMTANVVQINGSTREDSALNLVTTPLSGTDCQMATVDVQLNGVDTTQTLIDVWRGTNCNTTTQRLGMAANECTHISLSGQDLNINSRMMMNLDAIPFTDLLADCTLGDGRQDVWFLAANTAMSNTEVSSYATVEIKLDSTPPLAPINATGGSGGSQVTVRWEGGNPMGDASDHKEYVVYGDSGSQVMGAGCMGATTSIVPGEDIPSDLTVLSRGPGARATVNPADLGIEIGNSAYAAVVEVDQAGNVSVASDLVCISRVATSGFCDAAGENCQSCSVSGAGIPGKSAAPLLAIMGLALLALSRRKSRP